VTGGLPELRKALVGVLRQRGYLRREKPFQLSSGEWSHDYVDGKRALAGGNELRLAAEAVLAQTVDAEVRFDVVGGLTMGADPLAHAIAVLSGAQWFSVRKQAKDHGKGRLIEGAEVGPGVNALVLEDVVTTGRSLLQALDAVEAAGARIALAVTVLDRGDSAARLLAERHVPYRALTSYHDLGIEPVGSG
jgi:orotate phosphoribosyltransferase